MESVKVTETTVEVPVEKPCAVKVVEVEKKIEKAVYNDRIKEVETPYEVEV